VASPWSKTYREANHTLRKYRDNDHEPPSFEDMIFDADHSHRCPTYVQRTPQLPRRRGHPRLAADCPRP